MDDDYKDVKENIRGLVMETLPDLPYRIVTSHNRMSVAEGRDLLDALEIKDSDWDFQIDAGGTEDDPFRVVYFFRHEGDSVMFWLKAKV